MSKRVSIKEKVVLPSKGLIYDPSDKIPAEFNLRAMTTLEEKLRLSSNNAFEILPELIARCSDVKFDTSKLTFEDLQYLIFKLRIITYGPDYKLKLKCPICGHKYDKIVDLDSIKINYLDDSATRTFEIGPLPINNDILLCKYISIKDNEDLQKDIKRIESKFPDYEGDPELILKYNYIIDSINGEHIESYKIQEYIESLHARDFMYLESKYNKALKNYGLDLSMIERCPSCSEDIEFNVPINDEFFRPEY